MLANKQEKEIKHTLIKFSNLVKSKRVANTLEGRVAVESRNLPFSKARCSWKGLIPVMVQAGHWWAGEQGWGGPGSGGAAWTLAWPTDQDKWPFHSLSTSYATLTILCPGLVFLHKRNTNKLGQVKWEGNWDVQGWSTWPVRNGWGVWTCPPWRKEAQEGLRGTPVHTRRSPRRESLLSIEICGRKTQNNGYKLGQRLVSLDMRGKFSLRG